MTLPPVDEPHDDGEPLRALEKLVAALQPFRRVWNLTPGPALNDLCPGLTYLDWSRLAEALRPLDDFRAPAKAPPAPPEEPAIVRSGFEIVDRPEEPPAFVLLREFLETKIPLGKMGMFKLAVLREEDRVEALAHLDRLSAPRSEPGGPSARRCASCGSARLDGVWCLDCRDGKARAVVQEEADEARAREFLMGRRFYYPPDRQHPFAPDVWALMELMRSVRAVEEGETEDVRDRAESAETQLAERTAEVERLRARLVGVEDVATRLRQLAARGGIWADEAAYALAALQPEKPDCEACRGNVYPC